MIWLHRPFPPNHDHRSDEHATLLVALELSQLACRRERTGADRVSRHDVAAGDGAALLGVARKTEAASRARQREADACHDDQEAGFDGFWLHRLLEAKGIESHVVDAASVAVNRRQRRAKTDRIDLDMLLRTLAAFRRGERRVASMVHPPLPADEDRRQAEGASANG